MLFSLLSLLPSLLSPPPASYLSSSHPFSPLLPLSSLSPPPFSLTLAYTLLPFYPPIFCPMIWEHMHYRQHAHSHAFAHTHTHTALEMLSQPWMQLSRLDFRVICFLLFLDSTIAAVLHVNHHQLKSSTGTWVDHLTLPMLLPSSPFIPPPLSSFLLLSLLSLLLPLSSSFSLSLPPSSPTHTHTHTHTH